MLGHCELPFDPGLSERIGKIARSTWIGVAYAPRCTISNIISKLRTQYQLVTNLE